MPSSGTDTAVSPDTRGPATLIEAVCLIPEYPTDTAGEPRQITVHIARMQALHRSFAERFAHSYVLTIRNGLVRLGEPFKASDQTFADMEPTKRHAWLNAIRGQLVVVTRHRFPIVSLVSGFATQALRSLEFEFMMPLASMSQRLRRKWLEARLTEGNVEIWRHLFGVARV